MACGDEALLFAQMFDVSVVSQVCQLQPRSRAQEARPESAVAASVESHHGKILAICAGKYRIGSTAEALQERDENIWTFRQKRMISKREIREKRALGIAVGPIYVPEQGSDPRSH